MAANSSGAVVVTGASTGIGRATALLLDREGYRVFAGVRKDEDAKSLAEEGSDRLKPIKLDVTKQRSIATAARTVKKAVGDEGLVGLVNNAGIGAGGPMEFVPLADLREVLDVNVVGQVAVSQAFMALIRQAKGTVVFIASIGGRIAAPFLGPYSASKFGVEAVAEAMRREVSPWGIDVAVIEPGSIATEIWGKAQEAFDEQLEAMPAEARRLYGQQIENFAQAFIQEAGGRGIPPEKVAAVIHDAIRSGRPKHQYLVGLDAKIGARLNTMLPRRTFEDFIRRSYRQPKEPPAEATE
jgi:NAD(P)-dependent dehydrogenase (short-subunit alcohol dehydrogenase family)